MKLAITKLSNICQMGQDVATFPVAVSFAGWDLRQNVATLELSVVE